MKKIIPGNYQETLIYAAEHFVNLAKKAIEQRGAFHVALSGGSTPKALFKMLSGPPYAKQIDWQKVWIYWSDERCVGPNDPDSNYKMAMDAGLKSLSIPQNQIFRMEGELDPKEAALRYEAILPQHFDLIMLGMGDDGHTASLFPGTAALEENSRKVVANYIPQKNSWRLTLTFKCLADNNPVVFYVLGPGKADMVKKVFNSGDYPASRVENALWILDAEAAKMVGC